MAQILFVLSGGIGNIIQATPAMRSAAEDGHEIDVLIETKNTLDLRDILNVKFIRDVYLDECPERYYDYQLIGHFVKTFKGKANHLIQSHKRFSSHSPEAEFYYDMVQQIGVKIPLSRPEINTGTSGPEPTHRDTIAIYPGSKPDWAMKRWNKYDKLADRFPYVTVVGTQQDVHSHGNPTWIEKPWEWPSHVEFFHGTLLETAHYLSKCKMFVGNDGGLAHVAAATGITAFIIFGPSSIIKNKPYGDNSHAISLQLPCQPCQYKEGRPCFLANRASCPLKMKCMKDLTIDMVINKIQELI